VVPRVDARRARAGVGQGTRSGDDTGVGSGVGTGTGQDEKGLAMKGFDLGIMVRSQTVLNRVLYAMADTRVWDLAVTKAYKSDVRYQVATQMNGLVVDRVRSRVRFRCQDIYRNRYEGF